MKRLNTRLGIVMVLALGMVASMGAIAFATDPSPDPDVVGLATTAGSSIKVTAIAVILALVPLAIAVYLARKALPWAKRMIGR